MCVVWHRATKRKIFPNAYWFRIEQLGSMFIGGVIVSSWAVIQHNGQPQNNNNHNAHTHTHTEAACIASSTTYNVNVAGVVAMWWWNNNITLQWPHNTSISYNIIHTYNNNPSDNPMGIVPKRPRRDCEENRLCQKCVPIFIHLSLSLVFYLSLSATSCLFLIWK